MVPDLQSNQTKQKTHFVFIITLRASLPHVGPSPLFLPFGEVFALKKKKDLKNFNFFHLALLLHLPSFFI